MSYFVTEVKLGLILTTIILIATCKPGVNSRVKTLDQFAGGNALYACKGDHTDNSRYMQFVRGSNSESQKKAIENALSSVPKNFKDRVFLGPIQTYIEVTDNLTSKCQGSATMRANAQQIASIFACPVVENDSAIIYVDQDPAKIQSALVRAVAYYISQIDSKLESSLSSPSKLVVGFVDQGEIKQSKKFQGALVFLDEVAGGGTASLSAFSHLLPEAVLSAKNKASRDEAFFDPQQTNVGDRDAFAEYFYAEMLDSALCSAETRKVLAQKFPQTLKFFGADLNATVANGKLGLSDENQGSNSNNTLSRAPVTMRSGPYPIPAGLTKSDKTISTFNPDYSKTTTPIYYKNNQQYWAGPDGTWRQSDIVSSKSPGQSISKPGVKSSLMKEAPPVLSTITKPQMMTNSSSSIFKPLPSITSPSIVTPNKISKPSPPALEKFDPKPSLLPNLTQAQYPLSPTGKKEDWLVAVKPPASSTGGSSGSSSGGSSGISSAATKPSCTIKVIRGTNSNGKIAMGGGKIEFEITPSRGAEWDGDILLSAGKVSRLFTDKVGDVPANAKAGAIVFTYKASVFIKSPYQTSDCSGTVEQEAWVEASWCKNKAALAPQNSADIFSSKCWNDPKVSAQRKCLEDIVRNWRPSNWPTAEQMAKCNCVESGKDESTSFKGRTLYDCTSPGDFYVSPTDRALGVMGLPAVDRPGCMFDLADPANPRPMLDPTSTSLAAPARENCFKCHERAEPQNMEPIPCLGAPE